MSDEVLGQIRASDRLYPGAGVPSMGAHTHRHLLLAEVDRLRAENALAAAMIRDLQAESSAYRRGWEDAREKAAKVADKNAAKAWWRAQPAVQKTADDIREMQP